MSRSSTSSSDSGRPDEPASGVRVGLGIVHAGPDRRRFAQTAAVALLVVLLAEVALRVLPPLPPPEVWNSTEADHKAELMSAMAAEGRVVPTVYVGSSIMDAAIDPRAVAQAYPPGAGFNASLEGADGRSLAGWTTRVVVPTLRPDTVVLGVSPRELNDSGLNQQQFASSFFGSRGWRTANDERSVADIVTQTAEDHSKVIRSRSRLRDPSSSIRYWATGSRGSWDAPVDAVSGQLQRHLGSEDYLEPDPGARLDVFNDFSVGGASAEAIESAVEDMHRRSVAVVLVAPAVVGEDLEAVLDRDDIARSHEVLLGIGERTCTPVVDLRDLLSDRSLFADNVHVNGAGSAAVSAELGRQLAELDAAGELGRGC